MDLMGRPTPKTTLPYPVSPYWADGRFRLYHGARMIDVTPGPPRRKRLRDRITEAFGFAPKATS